MRTTTTKDSSVYLWMAAASFLLMTAFMTFGAWRPAGTPDRTVSGASDNYTLAVAREKGSFKLFGSINGFQTPFIVDTGATDVVISANLARRVGVRECLGYQPVMTANGQVNACRSLISAIGFGQFEFADIEALVMPNMGDEALLGMSALRCFHMTQQGGNMILTLDQEACPVTSTNLVHQVLTRPTPNWVAVLKYTFGFLMVYFLSLWGQSHARERPRAVRRGSTDPVRDCYYNPKEFRSTRAKPQAAGRSSSSSTAESRLLLACGGDRARMTRLMEYETNKAPFISSAEAAQRAIDRLERDRR